MKSRRLAHTSREARRFIVEEPRESCDRILDMCGGRVKLVRAMEGRYGLHFFLISSRTKSLLSLSYEKLICGLAGKILSRNDLWAKYSGRRS
jgi:hypothetical protein